MTTLTIDIRRASQSDADGISAVHDAAWREAYAGIIPAKSLHAMVQRRGSAWWATALKRGVEILVIEAASASGEVSVVGYATMGSNRVSSLDFDYEIYELYLQPEYQGLGFGRRLFDAALKSLRSRGARRHERAGTKASVIVWALVENDRAEPFYLSAGGVPVAAGSETFGDKKLEKRAYGWS
jgi:ribosomal protein S18 acetylase RimI-like enzyme